MNNSLYIVGPEPIMIGGHQLNPGDAIGADVLINEEYGGPRQLQHAYGYDEYGDVSIIAVKDPKYGKGLEQRLEELENNGKIVKVNDISPEVKVDAFMEKNKEIIDEMCIFSKEMSFDEIRRFMNDRNNRYNREYIKRMEINEDIHLYTGVRNRAIYRYGGGHDEELDDLEYNDATLCPYTGAKQFHVNENCEQIQIERLQEIENERVKAEKEIARKQRLEERARNARARGMTLTLGMA